MLYVRRGFGDEKSQLNELNNRLDQYLSRVRQLEAENQVLVEEIHRLRQERGTEWTQVYYNELYQLRRQVEDLSVQKCEAELQKDNLCQELQDLQSLWEQVRSTRIKIDQQLELYKQDLKQAKINQAALEELYSRLQQECQILQASQREEMFALRDQALQMPPQITMQEVVRPRLSLMDVQSLSLEISESWKEAFLVYQKKIEDLENSLRLDEEDRLGVQEEVRVQKLQIEELRKEYEELLGIQKVLETELLKMKEKYALEVEEYEIIIEELENEKRNMSISITERLKDYHDLMQVKTGLSLEVATYRALLEAETKKGTVILTEHSIKERPAGYIKSAFEETTKYSHRGPEYPITRSKEEIRRTTDAANIDRFLTRTVPQQHIRPKYTNLDTTSNSYISHVYENTTQNKDGRWNTGFPSKYEISTKTELPQTMYRPVQPAIITPFSPTQSTFIIETRKEEKLKDLKPVARPRTHSKEAKRLDIHVSTEDRKQDSTLHRTLETKTEENKVTPKPGELTQQALETNIQYITKDNVTGEAAVSVTESVKKDLFEESKPQEIPVKKERKKREQAKKRKEELEKVGVGDLNVAAGSKVDIHETTHVQKTVVLGEKESLGSENQQIVLEIPIQLEVRKTENSSQKSYMEDKAQRNVSPTYVNDKSMFLGNRDNLKTNDSSITQESDMKTLSGQKEKITLVDDILRHFGHSYISDESEPNIASAEKIQQDSRARTTMFGESMQREQIVLDIPIQYEGRKREVRSEIENTEHTEHSKLSENAKQMNVTEDITVIKKKEAATANKNYKDNVKDTIDSKVEDSSSEYNGKKAMVTDILRQLGQPTGLDDSNVTYREEEEQCGDGFVKTQIFVESKTSEEFDLFDEPDLTDLWNTTSTKSPAKSVRVSTDSLPEEIESRSTKKTVLKDVTGEQAEEWIGNVIHSGLQTGTGKSINVEIVEESFGTFEYEKGEIHTPFHVEEAEDNYNKEESVFSEQHSSIPTEKQQEETLLKEGPSQVEEVTEGEHVDEEIDYFVYVPDDNPCLEEEEEETLRGQIYTEEESHLKYSWQDEFLQGSQGRKSLSELLKNALSTEQGSDSKDNSEKTQNRSSSKDEKEQLHSESIVIEKKIEVPQEMKSSIIELLSKDVKDPQEKLKGALDCLQGRLPQDLVDELSALAGEEQTQSSSLAVDIKKVGQTEESGVVTIVAEINVSQTVDADDIDMLDLAKGVQSEVTTIHKSNIKASDDLSSFLQTQNINLTFAKESDQQQESYHSMETDNGEEHYTEEVNVKGPTTTSIHFSPTRELSIGQISTDVGKFIKHIELSTDEKVLQGATGFQQGSVGELSPTEINRSEHHLKIGPREMFSKKQIIFEGPVSETLKLDIIEGTEDSSDQKRSIRHIKISPTENFPEQIIFHGPIFKTVSIGQNQSGDQEKIIQDNNYISAASKTDSHVKINSGETSKDILVEGFTPRPDDLNITLDTSDNSAPIEYSFATPKVNVVKQLKYQGYVSEPQSTASFGQLKDESSINTSVHHIKLSPNREQIVFEGPISPNYQVKGEDGSHVDDKSRYFRHIRVSSPDSNTSESISFEGPTKELSEHIVSSPSGDSTESERSIKHIKLGPTEKSFTFQMDITKIGTKYTGEEGAEESSMVITSSKTEGERELSQSYGEFKDDSEVAESGYGEEEIAGVPPLPYITSHQVIGDMSEVDKTVQLQRIVQQGHMISDDKKVAVVYLDSDEDEEGHDQDYLRRSF